jgi:predicted CXXCH cytochrome family protein
MKKRIQHIRRLSSFGSCAVILICALFIALSKNTVSALDNQCTSCHDQFRELKKITHKPMSSGCLTCHLVSTDLEHPQQKDSIRLKKALPALCYSCHSEGDFQNSNIHEPVLAGRCLSCHDPHHSEYEYLSVQSVPELCFECHDKKKFTRKYEHTVSSKGCLRRCHSVHASAFPDLLNDTVLDICLICHASQASGRHVLSILPGGKIHPVRGMTDPSNPTREISCVSCHDPHSSNYANLAVSRRLCSRCHASRY